jgi:3-methyladenine DNA glycosylase AlkD
MTAEEILSELRSMGNVQTGAVHDNHGAPANRYGVKIEDLKKIQKRIKKNYELSLDLYKTGNADAQYLAGLIADEKRMTPDDLHEWARTASWHMISEYTVAWIAAESNHGWELSLEWIDAPEESIQSSGWSALSSLVSIKNDEDLDIKSLSKLLKRVEKEIHRSANRVRYTMNGFVISAGSYVTALTDQAKKTAEAIGKVSVDMGGTACKVPSAPEYIDKMLARGSAGKKKKMARC